MEPIAKTRMELLQKHPWFGALSMRLKFEPTDQTETMDVDGTTLRYNPQWFEQRNKQEREFWLAHQIARCALLHPYRCGKRDLTQWNEASALVTNAMLKSAFTIPADAKYDAQYDGLAVDTVYAKLGKKPKPQQQPQQQPKPQPTVSKAKTEQPAKAGKGKPGAGAGKPEAGKPGNQSQNEADWRQAVLSADMVTKKAGKHPGEATARATKIAREEAADWRAILREFIEQTVPKDYSWSTCNRRFIGAGFYLPGITKENTARIGVVVDTSGSISGRILDQFAREIAGIHQETRPEALEVVYCDTRVRHVDTFGPDDEVAINARGGGGTLFQPALDHFTRDGAEHVAAVVYLTDMENGDDKLIDPGIPVLWVTSKHVHQVGPFGQTVQIDLDF